MQNRILLLVLLCLMLHSDSVMANMQADNFDEFESSQKDNIRVPEKKLNLSTLQNKPLGYEEGGVVKGLIVDVVKEVSKRTGRDVEISIRPWERALREVESGDADGCFNTGNTETRRGWAYFNEEILYTERYVMFKLIDNNINVSSTFNNVDKLRVGIQNGYIYGNQFQEALDEKRFKDIDHALTINQNIRKLINKRIDFFVGDRLPTLYYLEHMGSRKKVSIIKDAITHQEIVVSDWPTFIAFSKKNVSMEYVNEFNEALVNVKRDGTYQSIVDKYLN